MLVNGKAVPGKGNEIHREFDLPMQASLAPLDIKGGGSSG